MAESVFKISQPRTELSATVAGVEMTTQMGLTSWAGFQMAGDQVMVMGDMVLQEDQINPVMSAALDNGLKVTALHNYFLWDTPRIMFMHIGSMGNLETLAIGVGKVFAKIQLRRLGNSFIVAQHYDVRRWNESASICQPESWKCRA